MSVATRVAVNTVVLLALAVAAAVALSARDEWGRPDPRTDVSEPVTVRAQWSLYRGTRSIHLVVTTEGVPLHEDELVSSPYNQTFQVPRGAVVTAVFDQPTRGLLTCRIDRPNRLGAPESREGPGKLTCTG